MEAVTRSIIFVAMVLLTIVSMWTTYVSLHDSILPEPEVTVRFFNGFVWDCSVFALLLSGAIGMMLFALKLAIVNGQKRLNVVGVIGMTVVAFISITFNLDVLYRTANRDFYPSHSAQKMKSVYESYLASVKSELQDKRDTIEKSIAAQKGELEAEIRGFRKAPEGYGPIAKEEAHQLTILEKTGEVELQTIDEGLASVQDAQGVLERETATIPEVEALQNELRAMILDASAVAGLPMPEAVRMENPLFTVIGKLLDWKTVGLTEIFFLAIAIFLDLGDIIGYSLVPNKPKARREKPRLLERTAELSPGFEVSSLPSGSGKASEDDSPFKEPEFPRAKSAGHTKWE